MSDTIPLLEVLRGAEKYLASRGVENARLNAEHLLAFGLGMKRMELYLQFDRELGEDERAKLRDIVRRRGAREPLQHILGTAEFYGRIFICDHRALIPRPETEQLVEFALEFLTGREAPRVLDVGTGSGCIALTLALEKSEAQVVATDISDGALSLAKENAERHGLAERVQFLNADLIVSDNEDKFDLIIANLPYIPTQEIAALSEEVRRDPLSALDGGEDGLDVVRRLVELAPERLRRDGMLLLETGKDQDAVMQLILEKSKFRDISLRSDYQGVRRFASGIHG